MPLLVSVLPVPSPAEATPRGIKRTRTPDRSGNGNTEGDQDDGMCAMGRHFAWHLVFRAILRLLHSTLFLSVAFGIVLYDRVC